MRWSGAFVSLLLLVSAGGDSAAENNPGVPERAGLGEFIPASPLRPAPAVSFADLAGNPASLSEFAGKIVLVNLWATWCEPCLREMPSLERMQLRLGDCRRRLNQSPLGAAALAGTSFPIDRHATAAALGFDGPAANSLDAVSDRDFAIEFLAATALAGMHLSRFAEEIVIWCSDGFGFVALSDALTTGSSIMPQKRNPDAAELVRAKTGRLNGSLIALLTVMKGLPLAYCKDMQEDKIPVFEAADTLELCLAATTGMVRDMRPDRERLRAAVERGFSTATDLADWLARTAGLPFRRAHHAAGMIVKRAEALGCTLAELPLAELEAVEPAITPAVYDVLDPDRSVAGRLSFGGTAPESVRFAVAEARKRFLE